ncbi:MAG TPA: hypothetical protein VF736_20740 [Pyrinomonadaceae bacterium]|jgi:hypothetical protein
MDFEAAPADFREDVGRALADGRRGDLALLAIETRGLRWGVEGLRVVGRAQLELRDWEGARESWEGVREARPEDAEAAARLAAVRGKLREASASAVRARRHVFVFTGHRIDAADRVASGAGARFPAEMEPVARGAVRRALVEELGRGDEEAVGIAGGASGGDIIFHEVCAELGVKSYLYLAVPREEYVAASVRDAGPVWVRRFERLYDALERRVLSSSEGPPRWLREKGEGYSVWQRCNLWMLANAVALCREGGGSDLTLVALWNGSKGDGAGGTEDMIRQAEGRGARTVILHTGQLFGLGG